MDTSNEGSEVPVKRKRGRPRKHPLPEVQTTPEVQTQTPEPPVKRKRGRPRKNPLPEVQETQTPEAPEVVNKEDNVEPSVTYEQTPEPKKRGRPAKGTRKKLKGFEECEWASDIMTRTCAKPSWVVMFEDRWHMTHDPEKGFAGPGYETVGELILAYHASLGFLMVPGENGENELWSLITLGGSNA